MRRAYVRSREEGLRPVRPHWRFSGRWSLNTNTTSN